MDYINMWMEWGDVLCLGSQRIFMYFELVNNVEIFCVYKCKLNVCSNLFNSYFGSCKWEIHYCL